MFKSGIRGVLPVFLMALVVFGVISGSRMVLDAAGKPGVSGRTSQTRQAGTVKARFLNVRRNHSARAKIIGVLSRGKKAYIIKRFGKWYQITFNGKTGWVYGPYLKNIRVLPAVPARKVAASHASGLSSAAQNSAVSAASSSKSPASATPSAASSAVSSSPSAPASRLPSKILAGYYAGWSAYDGFTPDQIDAPLLDVVDYAFAGIGADLKITFGDSEVDPGNFERLKTLKKKYPGLITLVSVGGWGGSSRFSDAALTDASRKAFAESCVRFIRQYGFDGVDIDWEYPVSGGCPGRPEDKTNFTLLMQALRSALTQQGNSDGRYYYLSFAGGASGSYINNVQLEKLASCVDFAVDMTYDLHGPWDTRTGLNAPLYTSAGSSPQDKISADSSLRAWQAAGFPAKKLLMGVPFYGYLYSGVSSAGNGLFQSFTSARAVGYDRIAADYLTNGAFTKFVHPDGQVPFLFGNGKFLSYDDDASVTQKARYVSANGLLGLSAWELGYDKSSVLLAAARRGLG